MLSNSFFVFHIVLHSKQKIGFAQSVFSWGKYYVQTTKKVVPMVNTYMGDWWRAQHPSQFHELPVALRYYVLCAELTGVGDVLMDAVGGMVTVNVEPSPNVLSTPTVPPRSAANVFVMLKPSPVPCPIRV